MTAITHLKLIKTTMRPVSVRVMAVKSQCRTGGQHYLSDESACGSEQLERDEGMPENKFLERDEEIPAPSKAIL